MAQGDMVKGIQSLTPSGEIQIKPSNATDEWVIHNVYYSNASIEMRMTNGTLNLPFEVDTAQGARLGMCTHVKSDYYLVVKNTHATNTIVVSYDGMQTK